MFRYEVIYGRPGHDKQTGELPDLSNIFLPVRGVHVPYLNVFTLPHPIADRRSRQIVAREIAVAEKEMNELVKAVRTQVIRSGCHADMSSRNIKNLSRLLEDEVDIMKNFKNLDTLARSTPFKLKISDKIFENTSFAPGMTIYFDVLKKIKNASFKLLCTNANEHI